MEERIDLKTIYKGVLNDFGSLGIILIIVFLLTIVMGVVFVLLFIFRDMLLYFGLFLSICLIPIVIIIGIILNQFLYKKIPLKGKGIWYLFRGRSVPYAKYSKKYRNIFIIQRFSFLSIMIILFFIMLFITGIVNIFPYMCCICAPISIPLILITITLPAMAWVSFTYAFDPYEPEPRAMIIIGIAWGIISTFPSLFFNTFNGGWMEDMGLSTAVFSAPIVEELFKSLGFFLIYSKIKDETDGLIYGATFGAGFSLMENLIYGGNAVFLGGGIMFVILVSFRSFFNIVGHMIGPAVIGYLIGWNKRSVSTKVKKKLGKGPAHKIIMIFSFTFFIFTGYVFSVINHGLWNYLAGFGISWVFLLTFLLGIVQIIFFIILVLVAYFLATKEFNRGLKRYKSRSKKKRTGSKYG